MDNPFADRLTQDDTRKALLDKSGAGDVGEKGELLLGHGRVFVHGVGKRHAGQDAGIVDLGRADGDVAEDASKA